MTRSGKIRILIVDDHAMMRLGLKTFLQAFDDFELVGEAADGLEGLRQVSALLPDVVLMDVMMPRMEGIMAIRCIQRAHPHIAIIAITSFHDRTLEKLALHAGALACLPKQNFIDDLAQAIRTAASSKENDVR